MAIEIGEYLSDEIVQYIDCWTNTNEFTELAKKHKMSDELARKLARSDRKITEKNKPLVLDIISLAIKNRGKKIRKLNKAHKEAITVVKDLANETQNVI